MNERYLSCSIHKFMLSKGRMNNLEMISIIHRQGHRENSEALGQKRKMSPPSSEASTKFSGSRIKFGKLLVVYFMRPSDLEALNAVRSLGACSHGAICPPLPLGGPMHRWYISVRSKKTLMETFSVIYWNCEAYLPHSELSRNQL